MVDTGCIHAVAKCQDCDWSEEDYTKEVTLLAQDHARENKHKVELELGFFIDGTSPNRFLKANGIPEDGFESG